MELSPSGRENAGGGDAMRHSRQAEEEEGRLLLQNNEGRLGEQSGGNPPCARQARSAPGLPTKEEEPKAR